MPPRCHAFTVALALLIAGCGTPSSGTTPTSSGGASTAMTADEARAICGPSPEGCRRTGCPTGFVCEVVRTCRPTTCSCDPAVRAWQCTEDCGGGMCIRAE